jgi:DNA polymerase-3 subunit epsilon
VLAVQRSFEDLGTPLHEVTFVVVDLETTGGSPQSDAITEIGAVKLRGGDSLGTLQTLINPGMAIPPEVVYLTGITETMVGPAPRIEEVLPAFLEFLGDAVIVGHNIRFDLGFLNAALERAGRSRLTNVSVDTCGLARRLVREEVRDCKLGTLARHFRLGHEPTHRALDDALATGELLHVLLERAGTFGVTGLDDLVALPKVAGHPQLSKLRLVRNLPRSPGVYLFRDGRGRVLYVGKAVDLRRRVRSYFTGDERRKIGPMLRELQAIDHIVCRTELEAAVLEVRMIDDLQPRYNRQGKRGRREVFVKLTLDEAFPRLSVVRAVKDADGCIYLGPFPSAAAARQVCDAIESAAPIRRCTAKPGPVPRSAPCAPAQLGVATCPCAGAIDRAAYAEIVDDVVRGLTADPGVLLERLGARMRALAEAGRFEEAADVRDRASALSRVLTRQRRLDALRAAGRLVLQLADGVRLVVHRGRLASPMGEAVAAETAVIASWLDTRHDRVRVVECEAGFASPLPRVPRFDPVVNRRSANAQRH